MRRNTVPIVLALACLSVGMSASAQSANAGDIRGTATDATGALLPDVTVVILNTGTGVSKTLTTNKDGLFDSGPIVTGNYTVTFSKDGFSNFSRTGLNLDVATVTIDGKLAVGSTSDTVSVNTDVALIQTETGEQSATLDFKTLEQLPNSGGAGSGPSWENFTQLIAGATGTPSAPLGNTPGQSVSVNGNLPYSSVLSDGTESTLPSSSNADVYVFETVQEVKVSTSAFSAQYGVGGILFNQISKGGSNNFHGSLYEYNQNDAYNAKPYNFSSGTINKNRVRFNNYGGSVGGPILKDRAFFYFDFDKTPNQTGVSGYATVPTTAQRGGDFSQQLVPGRRLCTDSCKHHLEEQPRLHLRSSDTGPCERQYRPRTVRRKHNPAHPPRCSRQEHSGLLPGTESHWQRDCGKSCEWRVHAWYHNQQLLLSGLTGQPIHQIFWPA